MFPFRGVSFWKHFSLSGWLWIKMLFRGATKCNNLGTLYDLALYIINVTSNGKQLESNISNIVNLFGFSKCVVGSPVYVTSLNDLRYTGNKACWWRTSTRAEAWMTCAIKGINLVGEEHQQGRKKRYEKCYSNNYCVRIYYQLQKTSSRGRECV